MPYEKGLAEALVRYVGDKKKAKKVIDAAR